MRLVATARNAAGRWWVFPGALFVIGLLVASGDRQGRAQTPAAGLNFSLNVAGQPECDTAATGAATCNLPALAPFELHINLASMPQGFDSYLGYDLYYTYDGVTPAGEPSTSIWPDCGIPAQAPEPGDVLMGCAIGLPPAEPSTYLGAIGAESFTCTASGAIVLLHRDGDTDLVAYDPSTIDEQRTLLEPSPADTLTINCLEPQPTPTAPVQPQLPSSGTGGRSRAWSVAGAALLVAIVAVAALLGSVATLAKRPWRRS